MQKIVATDGVVAKSFTPAGLLHTVYGDMNDGFLKGGLHTKKGVETFQKSFLKKIQTIDEVRNPKTKEMILAQLRTNPANASLDEKLLCQKVADRVFKELKMTTLPNGVIQLYLPGEMMSKRAQDAVKNLGVKNGNFLFAKSLFPESWSNTKIAQAAAYIAAKKPVKISYDQNGKITSQFFKGMYENVLLAGYADENGRFFTFYPVWNQP